MKPILISVIFGVAFVIIATGFLTRDVPVERMIPNDFETQTPISQTIPIQENQSNYTNNPPTKEICEVSYPDICIPPYPPDVDCDEIGFSNFRVYEPDPHGLDGDDDGIGCES